MTRYELFKEAFSELSDSDKINLYREYQREIGDEEEWYDFNEEFFELSFTNPMDAVRAWHFGRGGNNLWNDDYIHFNAYGNLETASVYAVAAEADDHVGEIFKHEYLWQDYIEIEEPEEVEED